MEIKAVADSSGKISIYVEGFDEKGNKTSSLSDLNYLLATKLFRSGYPKNEENRLKGMKGVTYDYASRS